MNHFQVWQLLFSVCFCRMLNCKHFLLYMRGKCIINQNFAISNFLWLFTSLWLFWQFLCRIIFSGENLKYQYVYFRTLKTSFIRFMSFPSVLLSINFHYTTFKENGRFGFTFNMCLINYLISQLKWKGSLLMSYNEFISYNFEGKS